MLMKEIMWTSLEQSIHLHSQHEDHPTPQEGVGGAHKLVARFLSADSRPIELGLNAMAQSCPANSHKQFIKGKHRKCIIMLVFDIGTVQKCWASLIDGKWWNHALPNTVPDGSTCSSITACHIIFQSHHRMCHIHSCPSAASEATSKRQ